MIGPGLLWELSSPGVWAGAWAGAWALLAWPSLLTLTNLNGWLALDLIKLRCYSIGGDNMSYIHSVVPSYFGSYRSPIFSMRLLKNVLNTANVLSSAYCLHHYEISSLKVTVCVKRVISFNTIVES